ncbi:CHAT domain-containing protein [Pseudoxanthomonas sp. PXM02]|uniref:CHAT domain-containing protein n=1 Tax=Pseudoxanthomonas sp. PXM02 TaxID=2769294 RepID=UPI00177DA821|nr:CHAT domain-containing protein [Pseudoxanthomonas sp. PXM02]MBD9477393.1 CHAT domain-containing protein [Pseudoxanthomonas sp. PXM02]
MAAVPDHVEGPWADLFAGGQVDRVNLVLIGRAGLAARLARLIFLVLAGATDEAGRPAFRKALVLLPPDMPDTVVADVVADTAQIRGYALDAEELEVLSRRLQVHRIARLETVAVLDAIAGAERGDFVIVVEGARYRPTHHQIAAPTVLQAPEDRWVPALVELATQSVRRVGEGVVVLIDVGEYLPALRSNEQALQDLDCTIWGADAHQAIDDGLMAQLQAWSHRVERGDIVSVLGEIDALAGLSASKHLLLKAQILHKGGRSIRALEFVRAFAPHLAEAAADLKLKLATIALAGEDLALAQQLLGSSADQLDDLELNELALELTQSIPSALIEGQSLRWLANHFPASSVLEQHQMRRLFMAARDGQDPAPTTGAALPLDDYIAVVLHALHQQTVPDYAALIEQADAQWFGKAAQTRLAAALDARRRNLPVHVAMLASSMDPESTFARSGAIVQLWSIEQLILIGDDQMQEVLPESVVFILCYLAVHPADTASRERLDELLSIDVAGIVGVAVLAYALLRLAGAPAVAPVALPVPEEELDAQQFLPFYGAAVEWLSRERAVDLATVVLPAHLLTLPADKALSNLKRMVQYVGKQEQSDDENALRQMVTVAFALAPHATRRNDDLEVLRLVTSRLAVGGQAQLARDLVEAGLAATQGRPDRLRLAWFAYGDAFHRMHNRSRALMAFGCALATHGAVELEHQYYETMGVVRALRDAGLLDPARQFLDRCEQLLHQLGAHAGSGHRIQTVRLGLQMAEFKAAQSREAAPWLALLDAIDANLQDVVREQDELTTVLVMAVQALTQAESLGLQAHAQLRNRIQHALHAAGEMTAELVQLAANTAVGPQRLLERARAAQNARYSDDVGFDVLYLVRAARSQLAEESTLADSTTASFAAELTSDHAIALPGVNEGNWLPTTIEEPLQTLVDLSQRGLRMEMLALDSADRLIRVSAEAGRLTVQREQDTFSLRRLHEWSVRFPFEYGLDTQDPNLFYTSMREIGLSQDVGDKAVFILDTSLQRLPPQLLLIDGQLLGTTAASAVAPSLTWLKAAVAAPSKHYGPPTAWISTAVEGQGNGTLATVADRVGDVLAQHGVVLHTGEQVPADLSSAELAIVAAHGGLADDNRFFKVISDEAQLRMNALGLARALEGAGVIILFVCSGGRQDEHPVASTTVGLPKQLLDRGSAAVIASPWPLDSRVPSHWLPAFLAAWQAGQTLIDAHAAGNRAVAAQMGNEPRDALAMTLYGNAFLRRADLVGH